VVVMMFATRAPGFASWKQAAGNLPMYGYQIVRVYPHDPKAFTQGLQYLDGALYEGTGQVGQSSIRKVELATGKVLQHRDVPAAFRRRHHRLEKRHHRADVADARRLRLRPDHLPAQEAVHLSR